jgi:hypothetical protein
MYVEENISNSIREQNQKNVLKTFKKWHQPWTDEKKKHTSDVINFHCPYITVVAIQKLSSAKPPGIFFFYSALALLF